MKPTTAEYIKNQMCRNCGYNDSCNGTTCDDVLDRLDKARDE